MARPLTELSAMISLAMVSGFGERRDINLCSNRIYALGTIIAINPLLRIQFAFC